MQGMSAASIAARRGGTSFLAVEESLNARYRWIDLYQLHATIVTRP